MYLTVAKALANLMFCPRCGEPLVDHEHFPQTRSCYDHGDFLLTEFCDDGSAEYVYKALPALPEHRDNIETR